MKMSLEWDDFLTMENGAMNSAPDDESYSFGDEFSQLLFSNSSSVQTCEPLSLYDEHKMYSFNDESITGRSFTNLETFASRKVQLFDHVLEDFELDENNNCPFIESGKPIVLGECSFKKNEIVAINNQQSMSEQTYYNNNYSGIQFPSSFFEEDNENQRMSQNECLFSFQNDLNNDFKNNYSSIDYSSPFISEEHSTTNDFQPQERFSHSSTFDIFVRGDVGQLELASTAPTSSANFTFGRVGQPFTSNLTDEGLALTNEVVDVKEGNIFKNYPGCNLNNPNENVGIRVLEKTSSFDKMEELSCDEEFLSVEEKDAIDKLCNGLPRLEFGHAMSTNNTNGDKIVSKEALISENSQEIAMTKQNDCCLQITHERKEMYSSPQSARDDEIEEFEVSNAGGSSHADNILRKLDEIEEVEVSNREVSSHSDNILRNLLSERDGEANLPKEIKLNLLSIDPSHTKPIDFYHKINCSNASCDAQLVADGGENTILNGDYNYQSRVILDEHCDLKKINFHLDEENSRVEIINKKDFTLPTLEPADTDSIKNATCSMTTKEIAALHGANHKCQSILLKKFKVKRKRKSQQENKRRVEAQAEQPVTYMIALINPTNSSNQTEGSEQTEKIDYDATVIEFSKIMSSKVCNEVGSTNQTISATKRVLEKKANSARESLGGTIPAPVPPLRKLLPRILSVTPVSQSSVVGQQLLGIHPINSYNQQPRQLMPSSVPVGSVNSSNNVVQLPPRSFSLSSFNNSYLTRQTLPCMAASTSREKQILPNLSLPSVSSKLRHDVILNTNILPKPKEPNKPLVILNGSTMGNIQASKDVVAHPVIKVMTWSAGDPTILEDLEAIRHQGKGDQIVSSGSGSNRRVRPSFSANQLKVLQRRFERSQYVSKNEIPELATMLKLSLLQVKMWFQNRRSKYKKLSRKAGARNLKKKKEVAKELVSSSHCGRTPNVTSDGKWKLFQEKLSPQSSTDKGPMTRIEIVPTPLMSSSNTKEAAKDDKIRRIEFNFWLKKPSSALKNYPREKIPAPSVSNKPEIPLINLVENDPVGISLESFPNVDDFLVWQSSKEDKTNQGTFTKSPQVRNDHILPVENSTSFPASVQGLDLATDPQTLLSQFLPNSGTQPLAVNYLSEQPLVISSVYSLKGAWPTQEAKISSYLTASSKTNSLKKSAISNQTLPKSFQIFDSDSGLKVPPNDRLQFVLNSPDGIDSVFQRRSFSYPKDLEGMVIDNEENKNANDRNFTLDPEQCLFPLTPPDSETQMRAGSPLVNNESPDTPVIKTIKGETINSPSWDNSFKKCHRLPTNAMTDANFDVIPQFSGENCLYWNEDLDGLSPNSGSRRTDRNTIDDQETSIEEAYSNIIKSSEIFSNVMLDNLMSAPLILS